MRQSLRLLLIVTLCLAAVGCAEKTSVDPALINVYADVVVARESSLDTVQAQADVRAALQRHGYTAERFDEELRQAGADPTTFRMLYDSVSARLQAKRRALQQQQR